MSFGMNIYSQRQNRMMNGKQVQSFMDPLPQGKRARLESTLGTVSTSGLSKANSLSQYSQDKSLPYRHTYMSCSLNGQETLDLPSPWSPSRIIVRNGGSPLVHSSATEGSVKNPVIYRPENVNFPQDKVSPTLAEEVVVKEKFAYSTGSPNQHSPSSAGLLSPVPFRKIPIGCTSLSPSTAEKSGGLAIPKPVYGHSPCCAGQKCTVAHSYTMGPGLRRMPPQTFEEDRMTYYGHWACMHKKDSDALMQQRLLPFEHCGERVPLNDVTTESYHGLSQSKSQRASAFSDPRQSNYMYNIVQPYASSPPDHCQRIQMPRQAHKDLPPMYEPMPGMQYGTHMQIYQDCPHTSTYRDIPQHPLLFCPKTNIDVYRPENSRQTSVPRPIPQPFFRELRNPYTVVPPGRPVIRNIPAYPAYGADVRTRHINPLNKRPFCLPVIQQVEQPLDFSMRREQDADSNQEQSPHGQLGIKGAFHQITPQANCRVLNNVHLENSSLDRPGQVQDNCHFNSHSCTVSPSCPGYILNKKHSLDFLENSGNDADLSKKPRVETPKTCENYSLVKLQTTLQLKTNETKHPLSPPMPVINKVFSLAPYKAYLEAKGVLSHTQGLSCLSLAPDSKPPKDEPETQNIDPRTHLDKDSIKTNVKTEKVETDERPCGSEQESGGPVISPNSHEVNVKEEQYNLESSQDDTANKQVTKEGFYSDSKPVTPELPERSVESTIAYSVMDGAAIPTQTCDKKQLDIPAPLSVKSPVTTPTNQGTFSLSNIPPHYLKLTSFKIILPEVFKTPELCQSPVENKVAISSKQARYQFMELHQSLCKLISDCITKTSHCELRNWLSMLDLDESASPPCKSQKVSCLLGSKGREVWIKDEETASAFQKVLNQLEHYVRIQECPFPHVIRAGAVFIPMLVVKEVLFAQVHSTYIDQVLQEHRVELRPTTLSEERQLTQLHKRAFSSKQRRLLSLKHLPGVYPDVLNLLYYADVCKVLGIDVKPIFKKEFVQCYQAESSFNGFEVHCMPPHTPDTCLENPTQSSHQKSLESKGRVKRVCKKRFLGDKTSSEEDGPSEESESWTLASCLKEEGWVNIPSACDNLEAHVEVKIESDGEKEPDSSWGCPLTSDDFSSESTDVDTEVASLSSYAGHSPCSTKKHSEMVLKLRKVYCTKGRRGQVPHYQRVIDQSEVRREIHKHGHRKKKHKRSESQTVRHRVRKFSSGSQHCSYLSTRSSSEDSRWVLRSAAKNARQTLSNTYPDLVGRRIRHLYEENDKTEVWYKGVVLRVHESHPNPLKTVFEVKYDSEPEWQYYLELLMDYKKGWLQIED